MRSISEFEQCLVAGGDGGGNYTPDCFSDGYAGNGWDTSSGWGGEGFDGSMRGTDGGTNMQNVQAGLAMGAFGLGVTAQVTRFIPGAQVLSAGLTVLAAGVGALAGVAGAAAQ